MKVENLEREDITCSGYLVGASSPYQTLSLFQTVLWIFVIPVMNFGCRMLRVVLKSARCQDAPTKVAKESRAKITHRFVDDP